MIYVLLDDQGGIKRFPYTLTDLRRDNPDVSFPKDLEAADPSQFGMYPVAGDPPSFDADAEELIEQNPTLVDGQWQRQWSVVSLSSEQVLERFRSRADYNAFWLALLQTNAFSSIRAQASQSLAMNTAATELIALLGDAKAGRPVEAAIQQSINAVLSAGSFTPDDLTEFQVALEAGGLAQIYAMGS